MLKCICHWPWARCCTVSYKYSWDSDTVPIYKILTRPIHCKGSNNMGWGSTETWNRRAPNLLASELFIIWSNLLNQWLQWHYPWDQKQLCLCKGKGFCLFFFPCQVSSQNGQKDETCSCLEMHIKVSNRNDLMSKSLFPNTPGNE